MRGKQGAIEGIEGGSIWGINVSRKILKTLEQMVASGQVSCFGGQEWEGDLMFPLSPFVRCEILALVPSLKVRICCNQGCQQVLVEGHQPAFLLPLLWPPSASNNLLSWHPHPACPRLFTRAVFFSGWRGAIQGVLIFQGASALLSTHDFTPSSGSFHHAYSDSATHAWHRLFLMYPGMASHSSLVHFLADTSWGRAEASSDTSWDFPDPASEGSAPFKLQDLRQVT